MDANTSTNVDTETPVTANADTKGGPDHVDTSDSESHSGAERVLEESKKYKNQRNEARREAAEMRKKLETLEQERLAEQGKHKERADLFQQKYEKLNQTLRESRKREAISKAARDAGCVDVDALIRLGNESLLHYDETSGTYSGVEMFVEEAKKEKAYLFTPPKAPSINPAKPGGGDSLVRQKSKVNNLSRDEFSQSLAKAWGK